MVAQKRSQHPFTTGLSRSQTQEWLDDQDRRRICLQDRLLTKSLVKDDSGFKVFGTVPSSISRVSKADVVEFTATLEPSKDDPKFGF